MNHMFHHCPLVAVAAGAASAGSDDRARATGDSVQPGSARDGRSVRQVRAQLPG